MKQQLSNRNENRRKGKTTRDKNLKM